MSKTFKKAYDTHPRVVFTSDLPSRTQQCFKDDCNINNILKRWRKTGVLEHVRDDPGYFSDVTAYTDYRDALHVVMEAEQRFNDLPADLRKRFGNDPAAFVDFVSNPENFKEMQDLGLAKPPEEDRTSSILDVTGTTDTNHKKPMPDGKDAGTKDDPKGGG